MKDKLQSKTVHDNSRMGANRNQKTVYPRSNVEDLSFSSHKLLTGKHQIHPYPAMMHPLLVRRLLNKYGNRKDVIFDPFCGSGSVLSVATELGHKSIGFDINPLALLIATVKTTNYDRELLSSEIELVLKRLKRVRNYDVPDINNLQFWYSDSVVKELAKIRYTLLNSRLTYTPFFVVAFAHTCRISSFTRNQEFKRYREKAGKRHRSEGFAFDIFSSHLEKVKDYYLESSNHQTSVEIRLENSACKQAFDFEFDLVLTSPPYGDHPTTVAYGQFSSFANEWTKDLNPFNAITYSVDAEGLGKKERLEIDVANFPTLDATLNLIHDVKPSRAEDVLHFFNGYATILRKLCANLRSNGTVCFVVGNRRVAGIEIPLDQITSEMFDCLGLSFVEIGCRSITNKVMPLQNSPSNISGKRGTTMTSEYVVVFKN